MPYELTINNAYYNITMKARSQVLNTYSNVMQVSLGGINAYISLVKYLHSSPA